MAHLSKIACERWSFKEEVSLQPNSRLFKQVFLPMITLGESLGIKDEYGRAGKLTIHSRMI
jgi:hypothetical protein